MKRYLAIAAAILLVMVGFACTGPHKPAFSAGKVSYPNTFAWTFVGNSNILFTAGGEGVLIDGWFTRYPPAHLLLGDIEPDERAIRAALRKLDIAHDGEPGAIELLAVIPGHTHFDHALDAGAVAALTGARLIGSRSTTMLGMKAGLRWCRPGAKGCVAPAKIDEPVRLGGFEIVMKPSRHLVHEFTDWEWLRNFLTPRGALAPDFTLPAHARDFTEGGVSGQRDNPGSYSIVVRRGDDVAHVHPSTNFFKGAMDGAPADIVFLSVAGLPFKGDGFAADFWCETVAKTGAGVVVPVHWDSLTAPLGDEAAASRWPVTWVVGESPEAQVQPLRPFGEAAGVDVLAPPKMWRPQEIPTGASRYDPEAACLTSSSG